MKKICSSVERGFASEIFCNDPVLPSLSMKQRGVSPQVAGMRNGGQSSGVLNEV